MHRAADGSPLWRLISCLRHWFEPCRANKGMELMTENKGDSIATKSSRPRDGWREAIRAMQERHGVEAPDAEWLDAELVSDEEQEKQA